MTKIRSMLADQAMVGEPERRGDERSEAPRSGGSPAIERAPIPVPPDPEVPARHPRRRFTTAYKLEILRKPTRVPDTASSARCCGKRASILPISSPGASSANGG